MIFQIEYIRVETKFLGAGTKFMRVVDKIYGGGEDEIYGCMERRNLRERDIFYVGLHILSTHPLHMRFPIEYGSGESKKIVEEDKNYVSTR